MGDIIPAADETLKMPAFKSVGWASLYENLGEFKYVGAPTTVKPSDELAENTAPKETVDPETTENKNKPAEPFIITRQQSNVSTVTWSNLHTL
jgi:hypothetical protein